MKKKLSGLLLCLLLTALMLSASALAASNPVFVTEGSPAGEVQTLTYSTRNELQSGTCTIHSYTSQLLSNGYTRFTLTVTAPAGMSICVFDPPSSEHFVYRGTTTGCEQEEIVFDLSAEQLSAIDSITMNIYSDSGNFWIFTNIDHSSTEEGEHTFLVTDGTPVGEAQNLYYGASSELQVHSYTYQHLSNDYTRCTLVLTAPAGLKISAFDPPNAENFSYSGLQTTGTQQTITFDIPTGHFNSVNSISVKVYLYTEETSTVYWVSTYQGMIWDADGNLGYYQNGRILDYTGLVFYNDAWLYFEHGFFNQSYTGLVYFNEAFFYVQNGVMNSGYTGLVLFAGVWYYVENGVMIREDTETASFITDGTPVGDVQTLEYQTYNDLQTGSCTIHSYTSQLLSNGYTRFTLVVTAPADFGILIFDPPSGETVSFRGLSATGQQQTIQFDLSDQQISSINSVAVSIYNPTNDLEDRFSISVYFGNGESDSVQNNFLVTDAAGMGIVKNLSFVVSNDLTSGSCTVNGYTYQRLANDNVRFTLNITAPAGLGIRVFDPPNAQNFAYYGLTTTEGENSIVFELPVQTLNAISEITVKLADPNDNTGSVAYWVFCEAPQDFGAFRVTGGTPVGEAVELGYGLYGALAENCTVRSYTSQLLSNGFTRFTMILTAPANMGVSVFDPPNGDLFMYFDYRFTTGQEQTLVFDIPTEQINTLSSFTVMLFSYSTNDRCIVSTHKGLAADPSGTIFYYHNGQIQYDFTGLLLYGERWCYVENGMFRGDYTGLVYWSDVFFYVENGVLNSSYSGLVYCGGAFYYVEGGVLNFGYTGLVYFADVFYYVENGVLNFGYTGLVYCGDAFYYVENGTLNFGYTGLVYCGELFYYVENGILNFGYTGLVYFADVFYYVENGILNFGYTGLIYCGELFYYVENGVLNWNYTGLVLFYDVWYYVNGGILDFGYTGVAYAPDGTQYHVVNGIAQAILDIYLAKVVGVTEEKKDANGHIITHASTQLNIYNSADSVTTPFEYRISSNNYAVGDYILVSCDDTTGTYTAYGLAPYVDGTQNRLWYNADKHTINQVDYHNAENFFLDEAGLNTSSQWRWFLDPHGNVIGSVKIKIPTAYAIVEYAQWINSAGSNGFAQAILRYMDGTRETCIISQINGINTHYVDNTVNHDEPDNFNRGQIFTTLQYNDDTSLHLYEVSTLADGTLSLTEVLPHSDDACLVDGVSGVTTADGETIICSVDNNTTFMIFNSAAGTYSVVIGSDALDSSWVGAIDYVNNADGIAEYVYINGVHADNANPHNAVQACC